MLFKCYLVQTCKNFSFCLFFNRFWFFSQQLNNFLHFKNNVNWNFQSIATSTVQLFAYNFNFNWSDIDENFEIFCGICTTTDSLPNEFDWIIANACLSTSFVGSHLHFNRGGSRTAATSRMEHFVIIVNSWKALIIITKSSIFNVAAVLDRLCHNISTIRGFQMSINSW